MNPAASQTQQIKKPAVKSTKGIVTSQNRIASEIGSNILAKGGNAVDAAIATSFALGVVEPWMSGIGGGGYMVIRRANQNHAEVIDFGMRSPGDLKITDYPIIEGKAGDLFPWPRVKDDVNVTGAKAIAIPGQVAGMACALEAFGTMEWSDLIEPAIKEAQTGLLVDWHAQLIIAGAAKDLAQCAVSKAQYFNSEGFPKASAWTASGETRIDQTHIAATLQTLAQEGPNSFYSGSLAQQIVADLRSHGGRHSLEDFANYNARLVKASEFNYKNHKIFGPPELTAGSTLQRVFSLLSDWSPTETKPNIEDLIKFDSSIRQANQERFEIMGDVTNEVVPSCTTHFNVVDEEGTMVSVTQTLLSIFGSRITLANSGILMNNGIMWFDPEPNKPNSLAPNKRCLSNMCPTLLERADGSIFALGAAGGRKIMPAVAQLASYLLDYNMDIEQAMHTPRIDCSLADTTIADDAFPEHLKEQLAASISTTTFAPRTAYPLNFACPSIISRKNNVNEGVTEVMSYWADAVAAKTN